MAILVSPGIDVQIIDESFYGSAGAGTIPLIVMATGANKPSPTGTGYAPYTAPAQAGKLFLATSQRELVQNFGNPNFHSIQGTQIHGHELNEFGLHAAYQYLSISNRAYVLRADIDLSQLEASDSAPRGEPLAGQYWFDLGNTSFGVFQSTGAASAGLAWESQTVRIAQRNQVTTVGDKDVPLASFGSNGDFAVVVTISNNLIFEKISGSWFEVGSVDWKAARPTTIQGSTGPQAVTAGAAIILNGVTVTFGTDGTLTGVRQAINDQNIQGGRLRADIISNRLAIRQLDGEAITLQNANGTPLQTLGLQSFIGRTEGVRVFRNNDAQYPAGSGRYDVWVKGAAPNRGAKWSVKVYSAASQTWVNLEAPLFPYDQLKDENDPTKDAAASARLGTPVAGTVYVAYDWPIGSNGELTRPSTGAQQLRRFNGVKWEPLVYVASFEAPTEEPADGTYWYNADWRADIMVGDGDQWVGYRRYYPLTDPMGPILMGSQPLTQTAGGPLADNDIWIDTSDSENYPAMYRYNSTTRRWVKIDTTDQTTPFGVVFADARQDSGPTFIGIPNAGSYSHNSEEPEDMTRSDYVDPDAPDPRAYPAGMMLFNTRYSTYNVKVWRPRHFQDGQFDPNTHYGYDSYTVGAPLYTFPPVESTGRWVTASGNKLDGSPYMGRKAQRVMVVKALSAAVQNNEDLRSELVYFNLMAAPGYPELIDELAELNRQQKEVSFIVADTPARLKPMGSAFEAWAKNPNALPNGEEGLSTAYTYCAVYYPWGLGRNVDGSEIMIPPSTVALCTYAYNDQVAYPWFAPAGFQRGLVTAATTVGYLTDEGEFKPVLLNQGQRDVLYLNKINPIAFIPGRGLVVYGQKTLHNLDSALDRVNVARLANYLKYNLDNLMKPFLFEQNDQQTRDSAKLTVERFLAGLVTLRALEDFAVLCNESNNTPERRDRNELWVDILIKPIKAIEFIYVPVRIRNSADDLLFQ